MEKATEIFEKHWTKATGKPLDEATKYAIEAVNEALLLGSITNCDHNKVEVEMDDMGNTHYCSKCRLWNF